MMEYDPALGLPFAFEPEVPAITLNQILSEAGLRQLHCAETEKYAHVTYFFNGGCPEPLGGEEHRLIPSSKVATYDLKPAMSAPEVADTLVEALYRGQYDFVVANFANGDMVGHTGVRHAVIEAVEVLDREVGKVLDAAVANGYIAVVTADHGNCDLMVDPVTDEPHTQHTTNPVPFLIVDDRHWLLAQFGGLADIAPTLLQLMGLRQPQEMQGRSLLVRELNQPALPTLANLNAA
jgi:2,3-bisphosphoglycerate-independent phosphoglycerate mutase